MQVRAFRRIPLPVDDVWATLSDHEGMSRWAPRIRVTLVEAGTPERGGIGAVRSIQGNGMHIREEVTGYEPGRRLEYRGLRGLPFRDYRGEVQLNSEPTGTSVVWTLSSSHNFIAIKFLLRGVASLLAFALAKAATREAAGTGK